MKVTLNIDYQGIEWTVVGDFVRYQPAIIKADPSKSMPAEGGYFSDMNVYLGEVPVYEMLNDETLTAIENHATREARGAA